MSFISKISRVVAAATVLAAISECAALAQSASAQLAVSPSASAASPSAASPAIELLPPAPVPVSDTTTDTALDPASLLPDLPELPRAKASLIGGTVDRLDRVRDQLTVQVFGGGKMKISFDPRTHVYDNGADASLSTLRRGDRVYVDTILDGSTVFARTIRVKTATVAGESQGTIMDYRADKGELTLRDALSPQPLKIRLTSQTQIVQGDRAITSGELMPGSLVAIKFGPQSGDRGHGDIAREIDILAVPGASFTFAGRVAAIDLRLGILVIDSSTDHKTYEISFDPTLAAQADTLRPDADVTVQTRFDGTRYIASTVTVNPQKQQ